MSRERLEQARLGHHLLAESLDERLVAHGGSKSYHMVQSQAAGKGRGRNWAVTPGARSPFRRMRSKTTALGEVEPDSGAGHAPRLPARFQKCAATQPRSRCHHFRGWPPACASEATTASTGSAAGPPPAAPPSSGCEAGAAPASSGRSDRPASARAAASFAPGPRPAQKTTLPRCWLRSQRQFRTVSGDGRVARTGSPTSLVSGRAAALEPRDLPSFEAEANFFFVPSLFVWRTPNPSVSFRIAGGTSASVRWRSSEDAQGHLLPVESGRRWGWRLRGSRGR